MKNEQEGQIAAIAHERSRRKESEERRRVLIDVVREYGSLSLKARLIESGAWKMPTFFPDGKLKSAGDESPDYRKGQFTKGSLQEAIATASDRRDPFFLRYLLEEYGIEAIEAIEELGKVDNPK